MCAIADRRPVARRRDSGGSRQRRSLLGRGIDLLECIGGQVGASLLNLRLAAEMAAAKEFEAFQAISTFFIHDLKNAASTLSLMLTNLPVHFDDPAFREDALRGIGSTVKRINRLIARGGAIKQGLELKPSELISMRCSLRLSIRSMAIPAHNG